MTRDAGKEWKREELGEMGVGVRSEGVPGTPAFIVKIQQDKLRKSTTAVVPAMLAVSSSFFLLSWNSHDFI